MPCVGLSAIERAKRYSKVPLERLRAMALSLETIDDNRIAGDVVECGVWRGGHIILARLLSPHRVCWLYDTFSGMTAPGQYDVKRSGESAARSLAKNPTKRMSVASLDEVVAALRSENVFDESKLHFVVGDVCQTLDDATNLPEHIAVLRLDTDWYESTKKELEVLWPRLVRGGHIIIDDYGHWQGARRAVHEYFAKHVPDYALRLHAIDYTAVMMAK